MQTTKIAALVASLFVLPTLAVAEEAPLVQVKRLTMDTALRIAQGAVAACRDKGIQIGVTVVDRDGTEQVILRDTIAPPITSGISKGKALTAANFNAATADLKSIAEEPVGRFPGLMPQPGGVPIEVGGALLGAVGVSGAADSAIDAECAQAGIDVVIDDLELGM